MCIACELGYLSIIDALEAEHKALREQEKATQFACEPVTEQDAREHPPLPADEPAP